MTTTVEPNSVEEADLNEIPTSFVRSCVKTPLIGGVVVLLLIVHGMLVFSTASYCTVTHDEYWHIPVGLLNLRYQRFDFDNLNPPLGRMIAAAPLLLVASDSGERETDVGTDLWDYGDDFLQQNEGRYHSLIVAARTPGVLLSVLFGLVTAVWATELFGFRSGIAALVLWTFSPSIISNAALATNDLFVSGLFVIAIWRSTKLAGRRGRKEVLLVGLALGTACLVKFTGVLLFALIPLTTLVARHIMLQPVSLLKTTTRILTASAVAVVVINTGYLFRGTGTLLNSLSFESEACRSIQASIGSVANLPVPLPRQFVTGIDHQRAMMEGAHPIYLNGEWGETGYRSYFFWVFAWKLPHSLQLLIFFAAWTWFRQRTRSTAGIASASHGGAASKLAVLLIPTGLLFVIGSLSDMQLGLRYILPSIPLLIIFATFSASRFPARKLSVGSIIFWLLVAISVTSARFHPHHLAYFNELAGGPPNGWKLLSDSNIDWGQDLRALKSYLDEHEEVEDLKLAYFGTFPPGALGLKYSLPSKEPQPGWYAVSVNIMQGRPNPLRKSDGATVNIFKDPFGYLRFFEPVARIGESIRVYFLTEDDLKRRRIEVRRAR